MRPLISLREALDDPALLGGAIAGDSWRPWRTLLIAAMGEPLDDDERAVFTALTGRPHEPGQRVEELWAIVGRRGGKTRAAATLAAYLAGLVDHTDALAPGERGTLPILAATAKQATKAFRDVTSILSLSPLLSTKVQGEPTSDTLRLTTGIDIEVRPASFRSIRSITAVAAICDEVSFWSIDGSSNPDAEVLSALRPSLATTQGPLIVISSPYAKRGEVYGAFKRDYGPAGDPLILVAKGASRDFNPSLAQRVVDRAYERDPAAASAEYGGEFRSDIEALLTAEAVEAVVSKGVYERAPARSITYAAFVDPSGGSADAMTLAIGHRDPAGSAILDAVRVRQPPFSPEAVVEDFAAALKTFGISRVTGDRYAGEWPREQFRKRGITYDIAEKPKSDLYRDFVPVVNGGQVALLDHPVLSAQLVGLERRTARGGRDSIDHAPGAHDDVANAVAGVVVGLAAARRNTITCEPLRI